MPSASGCPSVPIPSASECPSVSIPSASESLHFYYSFGLYFTNILPCRQPFGSMTDGILPFVSIIYKRYFVPIKGDEIDMNGATQENVPKKEVIKICGGADCCMVGATQEDEKYREIKNKAQEAENKTGAKNTLKKHVYYMRYKIRDVKNNFLTKILCSAE